MRIRTYFHGKPEPGGIARFGAAHRAQPAAAAPPAPEVPEPAPPPVAQDNPAREGEPPRSDAPAAAPPADAGPADSERPEEEPDDLAYEEPDPSSHMHDWLVHNWQAIKALEAAGQLPALAAPAPPGDDDPQPEPELEQPAERPVPYVARGDRWTKWKMAEFLRQLAATHSVTAAAKAVGMSRNSAHKLRSRLKGQPFDIAWEAAFRHGYDDLAHAALELALQGEEVPHYYQGELVATHRKRNPQLIMGLLKMRNRAGAPMLGRYGAAAEFWSEHWDTMTDRLETGAVTWDQERDALGAKGLARLELPDADAEVDRIIERNRPDEPRRRA